MVTKNEKCTNSVSSYEVRNILPDDILKKLPTEKEINMFIDNSNTNI